MEIFDDWSFNRTTLQVKFGLQISLAITVDYVVEAAQVRYSVPMFPSYPESYIEEKIHAVIHATWRLQKNLKKIQA